MIDDILYVFLAACVLHIFMGRNVTKKYLSINIAAFLMSMLIVTKVNEPADFISLYLIMALAMMGVAEIFNKGNDNIE